jgi:predicted transcriptional regulator
MHAGAAVLSQTPTRPVQVRLPEAVDELLTELARERGESKTSVVIEALECLHRQELERRMETGYRELAGEQAAGEAAGGEQDQFVRAALDASLPIVPD